MVKRVSFENKNEDKIIKIKEEIGIAEKKIAEYTKSVKSLYMDKVKGIISESDFIEFSRDFSKEKERLNRNVSYLKRRNRIH